MSAAQRKALVAGNWKMNGVSASLTEAVAIAAGAGVGAEVALCPPATLVARMADALKGTAVAVGGQDCHAKVSGAHTGDISAEMLKESGASLVIVGHSERRADHGEDDALVLAKAEAALRAGLVAVVCVGETLADREAGRTLDVVGGQVDGSLPANISAAQIVVAYEPVWAIGTGKTPTLDDIAEVHGFIRGKLRARCGAEADKVRILYGGSVKPSNAVEILALADVDGALVGGASLKAVDFLPIVQAAG